MFKIYKVGVLSLFTMILQTDIAICNKSTDTHRGLELNPFMVLPACYSSNNSISRRGKLDAMDWVINNKTLN